ASGPTEGWTTMRAMLTVRARRVVVFGLICGTSLAAACGAPKAKPKDPATETATNIRLAEPYYRAGRVNEALTILQKAVDSAPSNAPLRNYYGQLCFLSGRNADAEKAFDRALELDPYLSDARNNLGALYDATGRKAEAEKEYRKVLEDATYASPDK